VEMDGSRQEMLSVVRPEYDYWVEHQNCVREFSENQSRAEE